MIKAVLFDMGNTLVDSRSASETMVIILKGKGHIFSVEELKQAIIQVHDDLESKSSRKSYDGISAEDFYTRWNNKILEKLGITDQELGKYVFDKWFENLHIFLLPDVEGTLDELKQKNIKIGIITNGFRDEIDDVFTGLPIGPDYFDIVVGCNTTGIAKPHPEPFLHALAQLKIEPHEAIFVGDSYKKDYLGAEGVGMKPVLYLPRGELPAQAEPDVFFIRDLKEILDLI